MEIRRAADALLRSQASPLTSFLTPSLVLRWQPAGQLASRNASKNSVARSFTSSSRSCAFRTTPTTSAQPPKKDDENDALKTSKSLWTSPGSGISRSNRGLLNHVNSTLKQSGVDRRTDAFAGMLDVTPNSRNPSTLDLMQAAAAQASAPPQQNKIPLKLNSSTGRSIAISGNVDPGRGFRMMDILVARNRVRATVQQQRFHERGGLKRKRLRRERWRKRFNHGFKAIVSRVKDLKKQGW